MLERRLNEMDLMLNMNALNNAVAIMQMILQGEEKPEKEEVIKGVLEIAKQLRKWSKNDGDFYIMVYIDQKRNGKKPSEFDEFFTSHGFQQNERGGYYARMRQSEFGKLLSEHNWIINSFIIKTEIAALQEGK